MKPILKEKSSWFNHVKYSLYSIKTICFRNRYSNKIYVEEKNPLKNQNKLDEENK